MTARCDAARIHSRRNGALAPLTGHVDVRQDQVKLVCRGVLVPLPQQVERLGAIVARGHCTEGRCRAVRRGPQLQPTACARRREAAASWRQQVAAYSSGRGRRALTFVAAPLQHGADHLEAHAVIVHHQHLRRGRRVPKSRRGLRGQRRLLQATPLGPVPRPQAKTLEQFKTPAGSLSPAGLRGGRRRAAAPPPHKHTRARARLEERWHALLRLSHVSTPEFPPHTGVERAAPARPYSNCAAARAAACGRRSASSQPTHNAPPIGWQRPRAPTPARLPSSIRALTPSAVKAQALPWHFRAKPHSLSVPRG